MTRPYFTDRAWAQVPPSSKQGIADALLKAIGEEASEALAAGTLSERHDSHLSRTQLALDEAGWHDITELLEDTLDRVLTIQQECSVRLTGREAAAVDSKLAILHFESPRPAPAGESAR